MEKIKWKNNSSYEYYEAGTPIPFKVVDMFNKLYEAGYIGRIVLNAELFNKIHPEILFPKLDWDTDKIGLEVKRILEE